MANSISTWNSCKATQTIAVDYSSAKPSEVQIKIIPAPLLPRLFQMAAHWENYTPHAFIKSAFHALSESRKNFVSNKSVSTLNPPLL